MKDWALAKTCVEYACERHGEERNHERFSGNY